MTFKTFMKENLGGLFGVQQWKDVAEGKDIGKNIGEALAMDAMLVLPGVDELRAGAETLYLTHVVGDPDRAREVISLGKRLATSQRNAQAKNFFEMTLEKQTVFTPRPVTHIAAQEERPMTEEEKQKLQQQLQEALAEKENIKISKFFVEENARRKRLINQSKYIADIQAKLDAGIVPKKPSQIIDPGPDIKFTKENEKLEELQTYLNKNNLWDQFGKFMETGSDKDRNALLQRQQQAASKRQAEIEKQMQTRNRFDAMPANYSEANLQKYNKALDFLKDQNERKGFSKYFLGKTRISSVGTLQKRNMLLYFSGVALANESVSYEQNQD